MSKKLNTSGAGVTTPKNTLFKYFAKSPASLPREKKEAPQLEKENEHMENHKEPTKRKLEVELQPETEKKKPVLIKKEESLEEKEDDDEEDIGVATQKKRRRAFLQDSSSDDEDEKTLKEKVKVMKQEKKPSKSKKMETDSSEESDPTNSTDESEDESARKKNHNNNNEPLKKKPKLDTNSSGAGGGSFMEKLQSLQATAQQDAKTTAKNDAKYEKIVCTTSTLDEPVVWPHQKLEFIKPDKIKDKKGRRPDHPDYEPGTLQVPTSFLDSLSPGVRQWWVLKSDNWDCVLFFKVGKFYELYHMDADVGVNELGFTYMRGEFAHSGFPEVSFDKMSSILIDRGYKVARVEQTETVDMMTERCKRIKPTKFDKVVRREICQITNRGTQVFGSQCQITPSHQPNYMLALVEKTEGATSRYGICYIDTSIGDFYMGEFTDDKNCSRLLTLLSHHMPVLLLTERAALSERSQQIMRTVLGGILKEYLSATEAQTCEADKTLKQLAEKYFAKSDGDGNDDNWPLTLRAMQAESDHLGLTPRDGHKLALKALGVCMAYMRKCQLEAKVLPMARFHHYTPPDMLEAPSSTALAHTPTAQRRSHMVLDATTLANLRIADAEHSLLATLDNCCTKFGKRLLHHWLCAPSCDVAVIVERQCAITDLLANGDVLQACRALLAPMPDFERHLAQIHLFGNKNIMESHPDGRAILFEEKQYNKKKIQNFIAILNGFKALTKIPQMFQDCSSALMKRLTQLNTEGGIFPCMSKALEFFKNAFDHEEASKSGVIAPEKGVDADYDAAESQIAEINQELKEYLVEQEKYFGCRMCYFGADKKRFQLEVPESNAHKAGKSYSLEGQAKGKKPCRRFSTEVTKSLLKRMQQAEDERKNVLNDLARRIFEKFSAHYALWKQCVDCVSHLDVLGSLAEYARQQLVVCVPKFEAAQAERQSPLIEIEEGYHPCVPADSYIPNGIQLGVQNSAAPLSLLTGPNMGGKSTLMRQVGLLVVMAQIGAHVPAQCLRLSVVDRIFTRLGAQDDILAGHSTFLVELNETSLILKHATANSLVLLDELGRGTATYDGTAIAASVVNFLADLKCRTLFSTHYHNLIDFFHKDERITLGHMACMVENEDTEDPTQETVTFLYKYTAGACPKSYGFNAAKLAGMPHPIIKRAYELSKKVEAIALKRKIAAKIVAAAGGGSGIAAAPNTTTIKNLLLQLKMCRV